MRRKLFKYLAVLVILAVIVLYWMWPRDILTAENLSRINLGMTTQEVIQILGTPTSQQYSIAVGYHLSTVTVNGIEVPQHNEVFEPKTAWFPRIMIDKPRLMPIQAWQEGKLYFWADEDRILMIQVDNKNVILNITHASITKLGGGLKGWLSAKWSGSPARPIPTPQVTRAVPASPRQQPTAPPPIGLPSKGPYEFIPSTNNRYRHRVGELKCVGTIDSHGDFQPELQSLASALEAYKTRAPR
ncbi:MAG: hypothetical protein QM703_27480 [Gemmatales bacterium]